MGKRAGEVPRASRAHPSAAGSGRAGDRVELGQPVTHPLKHSDAITRGIREFLSRNWSAARDAKDLYWRERIDRLGPAEGFRIAEELRRHTLALDPQWPDEAHRSDDVEAHARLAELLRRATPIRRT